MIDSQNKALSVLLVDPNRRVRSGLEVSLKRYGFDVLSVDSDHSALSELRNGSVGIVLVDCSLPEDRSFKFCQLILKEYAKCAVVMTSFDPTRDIVIKAVRAGALEFIAKPANAELINVKIKKAYARAVHGVRWAPEAQTGINFGTVPISTGQKIDILVKQVATIRALPHAVGKILQLVSADTSNAGELAKVVESDPSIAAMIMKRARSSFYTRNNPASDLKQAVIRLGFKECSELAISLSVFKLFSKQDKTFGFSRVGFWLHSIACGLLARQVAVQARLEDTGKALMVGLLHDIGKIILDDFLSEEFQAAVQSAATKRQFLFDAEMEMLERTHVMVGQAVVEKWRFPPMVREIIHDHHQHEKYLSQNPTKPTLAGAIYLSNHIAKAILVGEAGDFLVPDIPETLWRSYGFDGLLDADFLETFYQQIELYCGFLEIPKGDLETRLDRPEDRGNALLFDPDSKNTLLLQIFLAHQGFNVQVVPQLEDLAVQCGSASFCLMVLDSSQAAEEAFSAITSKGESYLSTICILPNLDISNKLSSARPWLRVATTPIDCFELHSQIASLLENDSAGTDKGL